ncbi:MAG: FlgD immunoglobulin-like domain containing protein [Candidatus Glassbacteria bacterium]
MRNLLIPILSIVLLVWNAASASGGEQGADFEFEAPLHIAIDTLSFSFPMYAYLTNTGDSADIFTIQLERDLPDTSWDALLCIQGFCFPPFVTTAAETLGVGEYDSLMDVTFVSKTFGGPEVHGAGYASLTVTSMRDPSLARTLHFTFISDGTEILVVDDDGGEDYESYYENAIGPGLIQGTWRRSDQAPTQDDLSHFQAIIWETGEASPTLSEEDRNAIGGFLDNSGRLFISGQDIGFALSDSSSDEYSQSTLEFYNNYLGAQYLSDDIGSHSLSGIPGDPISDGIDILIQGGDGADNQTSPDAISPIPPASRVFEYDQDNAGAIKVQTDGRKVVYMSFGYEAINSQEVRSELMQRIIDWLMAPVGIDDAGRKDVPLPGDVVLRQNHPNPFNPQTQIVVDIVGPDDTKMNVALAIYSLRGRMVRNLFDGELMPGRHSFMWNGKDGDGLDMPSGVYLYRLTAGDRVITRKMLLVR